jgi:chromate reductase
MITIISSTNRPDSRSLQVALYYKKILDSKGVESKIIDLTELPYDFIFSALYHNLGKNEVFNKFIQQVNDSEKFVFIVPEYNGSFPGTLKAFIDGMEYPGGFRNKKCALVGLSSGTQGGSLALSHLTDIMHYLNVIVLPSKPRLARVDQVFQNGEVTDKFLRALIDQQAEDLINI